MRVDADMINSTPHSVKARSAIRTFVVIIVFLSDFTFFLSELIYVLQGAQPQNHPQSTEERNSLNALTPPPIFLTSSGSFHGFSDTSIKVPFFVASVIM